VKYRFSLVIFAAFAVAPLALIACSRTVRFAEAPEATAADLRTERDAGAGDGGAKGKRASVVGSWHGIGKEGDGDRWNVVVTLTSAQGPRCAVVRYPSLGCVTQWNCPKDGRNDGILDAKEKRLSGRCADGADVHVERNGDALTVKMKTDATTSEATLSPGDRVDDVDDNED